jgi:hypothetical protein
VSSLGHTRSFADHQSATGVVLAEELLKLIGAAVPMAGCCWQHVNGHAGCEDCSLAHLLGPSQSEMVAVLEERECLDEETKDANRRMGTERLVNEVGKERCKVTPHKAKQARNGKAS